MRTERPKPTINPIYNGSSGIHPPIGTYKMSKLTNEEIRQAINDIKQYLSILELSTISLVEAANEVIHSAKYSSDGRKGWVPDEEIDNLERAIKELKTYVKD